MPEAFELEVDEPKPKDGPEVITTKEPDPQESKVITAEEIQALTDELAAAKRDRDSERSGRVAAEGRTREVEQTSAEKLKSEIEKRLEEQGNTIATALVSAQAEIDSFRALAAKAMEDGKWADAAEATENMADAKVRLRELTYQKQQVEQAKTQAAEAAKNPRPAPGPQGKTAAWIAAHPRFNTDPQYNAAAMAAHYQAIRDGIAIESDQYFQRIEEATGDRKVEQKVEPKAKAAEGGEGEGSGRRGVDTSGGPAPVTRRATNPAGSGNGGGPKKITLTGDQVEAADSLFGDPTNPLMYIKDPKERYTYWHSQQERLKSEGRM